MQITNAQQAAEVALAALKGWDAKAEGTIRYLPKLGVARFVVELPNGQKLHVRVEEE